MKKRLTLITLCIVMVLTTFNNVWGADIPNNKDDRSSVVAVKPQPRLEKEQAAEPDSTTESSATEVRGNSVGNIGNGGNAAIQGDWIYYRDYNDNDYLYKIKTDDTNRTQLNSDQSSDINVVGDWIYYRNLSDNGYIYKIKTDGTNRTKLNNDGSRDINVVGDWIYYSNHTDNGYIYKIKTDGTNRTKLNNEFSRYINVVDDWIYYRNDDDWRIYKIKTDGTNRTKLNNDSSECINVVGDWIYYANWSDDKCIYKIKTDGTNRTKLNIDESRNINVVGDWVYYVNYISLYRIKTDGTGSDEDRSSVVAVKPQPLLGEKQAAESDYNRGNSVGNIGNGGYAAIQGDWIYYRNYSDNSYLYKIKADDTNLTKLNNDDSIYINVVDDWIYYSNYSDNGYLYKIKTDGTNRTKLNSDESDYINVVDDWIYYKNWSDDGHIYKMKTDGTNRTKLNNENSMNINIVGDWIYYNNSNNNALYRIKTDGTGRELVAVKPTPIFEISEEAVEIVIEEVVVAEVAPVPPPVEIVEEYGRDFPMDEDTFIDLVNKEINRIFNLYDEDTYIGYVNDIFIDLDFDGIPELFNNYFTVPTINLISECYNFAKGKAVLYDIYIDGKSIDEFLINSISSIFLKKDTNGNNKYYSHCSYFTLDENDLSYSYSGIYRIDVSEEADTGKLSISYIPIAQKTSSFTLGNEAADNNAIYKLLKEETGKLLETTEDRYKKFVEEFNNTGSIDHLTTDSTAYYYDFITYTTDSLDILLNRMKKSIIDAAEEYIDLYKKPSYTVVEVRGNSNGNIVNGGIAAIQDDWIYYRNYSDNSYLYKIKTDGTNRTKLNNDSSMYINVLGDWIYYSNYSDNGYIYKIKTDGSSRTKLISDRSEYINVVDNWIYYTNYYDSSYIYKIKTDGTNRTKVNSERSKYINVIGEWIYYDSIGSAGIYKIKTNGSSRTKLSGDINHYVNAVDDWVYYYNTDLYKMKTDGSDVTVINSNSSYDINVVGDWIYYRNASDNNYLYKIKTDGSNRTKLNSDASYYINIIGDWIYYTDNTSLYRIKTDGTGREIVE